MVKGSISTRRQKKTGKKYKKYKKYKKTKKRPKQKWKDKKAGLRFRDIITMENKDDFVGLEVEIKRIEGFEEETFATGLGGERPFMPLGTDLNGIYRIEFLMNIPGFVAHEPAADAEFVASNTPFVNIYYPRWNNTISIPIPNNLRELAHREGYRHYFNYYLQLRRNRANRVSKLAQGDLFTKERISAMNTASAKRNILNPPLRSKTGHPEPSEVSLTARGSVPIPRSVTEYLKGTDKRVDLPPEVLSKIAEKIKIEPKQSRMEKFQSKLGL